MKNLNILVTYIAFDSEAAKDFVAELENSGAADKVRAEDGCIKYDYYFSAQNPEVVLLVEEWESAEHQKVHMTQPHMADVMAIKDKYIKDTQVKFL